MKTWELSRQTVAATLQNQLGLKPNYSLLQEKTGVHRHIIRAMHTGNRDYKVSALFQFCEALKIDLLK